MAILYDVLQSIHHPHKRVGWSKGENWGCIHMLFEPADVGLAVSVALRNPAGATLIMFRCLIFVVTY
jgi:hypothetical protein